MDIIWYLDLLWYHNLYNSDEQVEVVFLPSPMNHRKKHTHTHNLPLDLAKGPKFWQAKSSQRHQFFRIPGRDKVLLIFGQPSSFFGGVVQLRGQPSIHKLDGFWYPIGLRNQHNPLMKKTHSKSYLAVEERKMFGVDRKIPIHKLQN